MHKTTPQQQWRNIPFALAGFALAGLLLSASCTQTKPEEPVAAQNASLRNSPIVPAKTEDQFSASAEKVCYWNDKKYSDGALICENHRRRECWKDKWVDVGNC